jgi:phosphoglucomutase
MEKMSKALKNLRANAPKYLGDFKVVSVSDYLTSVTTNTATDEKTEITLPKSDVLCYGLENGSEVIIRPSGTEPKIKIYISAIGSSIEDGINIADKLQLSAEKILNL